MKEDVTASFREYLDGMDQDMCVNYRHAPFILGEFALLKSDFDNNTKTKKKKLHPFFENKVEIMEVLGNNRFSVKKSDGNLLTVKRTQLRPVSFL